MIISPVARNIVIRQGARGLSTTTTTTSSIFSVANKDKKKQPTVGLRSNQQRWTSNNKTQQEHAPTNFMSTSSTTTTSSSSSSSSTFSTIAIDDDNYGVESRDTYQVSRTLRGPDICTEIGIAGALGITNPTTIYRNLSYQEIYDHEQKNDEGVVAKAEYGDTFSVHTGKFTGRSPKDRFLVKYPNGSTQSADNVDWNNINKPTSPKVFSILRERSIDYFNTLDEVYVLDCYVGASESSRKKIRFVHEMAWQQHFCTNMFIRPVDPSELDDFVPDFTVINSCSVKVDDYEALNLNSETAVVFDIEQGEGVIFGTYYGGENKKGIFSLMNYLLPLSKPHPQLPMHCSANVSKTDDNDVCLFFGLSGTGKTTLSADPHRALIGDDEHGWDEDGVYNFEGGCYAKTINLTEQTEPDIYRAIHTDALLENVMIEKDTSVPDYFDTSLTENGRVSYPIFHIDGYHKEQTAGHPNNIIFLSCDAFGVLPPVAKLSSGEAMYHFLSGYTAKVAGTERGVKEPSATFSTCFGAAFMTLHPTVYADLLQKKLDKHGTNCYLVNSGWSGGPYGVGERMSIGTTRICIDAILNGSILEADFEPHPIFGFNVPKELDGVSSDVLNVKGTWSDGAKYDEQATKLGNMYIDNFKQYEGKGTIDYTQFGPKV
jgi:ATP-dependent phosphoenolpyruvate carboxykinase